MKVSAVIATFNRRNYIARAIDSILAQTVPVDEILVVDDVRTTDGTEEALKQWYGSRVRVVRAGGGLSGARRRGVQEARGEWIAYLDSDDDWSPDRNKLLLEAVDRVPADVAWVFGDMRVVTDKNDQTTLYSEYGLTLKSDLEIFEDSMTVQYPFQFGLLQGSLIRRRALIELNCFNEGLQSSEDLLAGFEVACKYKYAAIPAIVGRYFVTSDLAASSASVAGVSGPDYFRARMLSFARVIESGHKHPWDQRYAAHVRGYAQALARRGNAVPRRLAFQQFRYGAFSAKGLAFSCAALFGRTGVQIWNALADFRRKHLGPSATRPLAATVGPTA